MLSVESEKNDPRLDLSYSVRVISSFSRHRHRLISQHHSRVSTEQVQCTFFLTDGHRRDDSVLFFASMGKHSDMITHHNKPLAWSL